MIKLKFPRNDRPFGDPFIDPDSDPDFDPDFLLKIKDWIEDNIKDTDPIDFTSIENVLLAVEYIINNPQLKY